jgi:phosphoglycerate dehydrogenase-like enzyme
MKGFGANIICYDVYEADVIKEIGGKYVSKDEIFAQSDILFLMSKSPQLLLLCCALPDSNSDLS